MDLLHTLGISERELVGLGTLRLVGIRPALRPPHPGTAEASQQHDGRQRDRHVCTWKTWMPGSFLDDFTSSSQASSIKGKGPAKGGTRKRKRSGTDTAAAAGILSRQHTVASDVDPQTASSSSDRVLVAKAAVQEDLPMVSCKDLDHLVSHLFAKVEYRTLCDHEDPDGSPVDDQHVRCNVLARIYAIPLDTLGLNSRLDSVGRRDLRAGSRRRIAENAFRRLLHHLRFDLLEWLTGEVVKRAPFLLPRHQEPPSLQEIYNNLDDPAPTVLKDLSSDAFATLRDILEEDAPEGMSSRLFDFQKHCLWKLASRELAPQRKADLTFRESVSMNDPRRSYFIESTTNLVWNAAPLYVEPKSGIVSEGMGTGKTCICLALVMATKHRLASIDWNNLRPGTSLVSSIRTGHYEAFPWSDVDASPESPSPDNSGSRMLSSADTGQHSESRSSTSTFPSLRDITLDLLASTRHRAVLAPQLAGMHTLQDSDIPYVWETPAPKGRDDTRSQARESKKVYLSGATLVIVPDILVAQWLGEITKHIKKDALDYVKVEKNEVLPSASDLSKVDLVLISESRIRAEAGKDRDWEPAGQICRCSYIGSTRQVVCRCRASLAGTGTSPLRAVWWKRLIVDEGHKVAGKSELVKMCLRLRSESRYIVSGTPSKNLVGSNDVEDYEVSASAGTRSNADRADFERLANISVFLNLQPFCTEPNPFMRTFFDPYFERGDTTAIADFLSHVMIRHKVPDFVLPPLTRDTVELEFNPLEKLTYNVLLALFASNAVQSERSDEDYFFHAKQKASLNALISNLGAAHLLFSSPELVQAAIATIASNQKAIVANLAKPEHRRWKEADARLLREAQDHLHAALDDILWRCGQTGSMIFSLKNLHTELGLAWGGTALSDPDRVFMTGEKISALRVQIGKQSAALSKLSRQANEDADTSVAALADADDFIEELITFAVKASQRLAEEARLREAGKGETESADRKVKAPKRETDSHSARRAATEAFNRGSNGEHQRSSLTFENIPMTSDLPFANMTGMASTKVAYIVTSVMAHPTEKFLVFSGGSSSNQQVSSNNLYYIAEALDLANIPHLILARTLSQEKLAAYVRAFNEGGTFRVLLLEIKYAGRGLTLHTATRVIFSEPVWHKDEEAQAVKRAHRLGQAKPVHVETLVMKGSFEEKVMQRGAQLSRRDTSSSKTCYDDNELAAALRSMSFLSPPATPVSSTAMPTDRGEYLSRLSPPLGLIPTILHDVEGALQNAITHHLSERQQYKQRETSMSDSGMSQGSTSSALRSGGKKSKRRLLDSSRFRRNRSRGPSPLVNAVSVVSENESEGTAVPASRPPRVRSGAILGKRDGITMAALRLPEDPLEPRRPQVHMSLPRVSLNGEREARALGQDATPPPLPVRLSRVKILSTYSDDEDDSEDDRRKIRIISPALGTFQKEPTAQRRSSPLAIKLEDRHDSGHSAETLKVLPTAHLSVRLPKRGPEQPAPVDGDTTETDNESLKLKIPRRGSQTRRVVRIAVSPETHLLPSSDSSAGVTPTLDPVQQGHSSNLIASGTSKRSRYRLIATGDSTDDDDDDGRVSRTIQAGRPVIRLPGNTMPPSSSSNLSINAASGTQVQPFKGGGGGHEPSDSAHEVRQPRISSSSSHRPTLSLMRMSPHIRIIHPSSTEHKKEL